MEMTVAAENETYLSLIYKFIGTALYLCLPAILVSKQCACDKLEHTLCCQKHLLIYNHTHAHA